MAISVARQFVRRYIGTGNIVNSSLLGGGSDLFSGRGRINAMDGVWGKGEC